ncbi:MAG: HAMP domain-containing protein [Anaerolineales bacterium]|nr:HAMP domain-containing protein [Anaerolineales bacterium]
MTVEQETRPLSIKLSLRYKLLIGFTLVFSLVFAVAYYWFYTYSTTMAMGRIEEDLRDTLRGTIGGIDGNAFASMVIDAQPDESGVPSGDMRYIQHQEWLETVHNIEPRAFGVYTYVHGSKEGEILWIGDSFRFLRPDSATTFREPYETLPYSWILRGFDDSVVNPETYTDEWGRWMSAYGPVKSSSGEVVGAVGIDFNADYVDQVRNGIRRRMLFSFIIAYASLFAMVYLVSSALTNPIIKLTNAAERVGEGDYEQDFSSLTKDRLTDEIDLLASNFSVMVGKVYQREQTLRRQVEALKIEIDEAKRSQQVSEIVDTDFFRDLQAKADRMRIRRQRGAEAPGQED